MSAKTSEVTFKKLPGVFALNRGMAITDAEMFNEIDGEYEAYPVKVIRHGIRGTQNVDEGSDAESATTRDTTDRKISNIQQTDSAKLDPRADALIVRFAFRPLPLDNERRYSIAPDQHDSDEELAAVRKSIEDFIGRAKGSEGLMEVSRRIARNLLNGRWLWRNRTIARSAETKVFQNSAPEAPALDGMEALATSDALAIPLNRFDNYTDDEKRLGESIALNLSGQRADTMIVEARVTFGFRGAVEVFPSQNYIENKPQGFARPLYRLGTPDRGDPGRDVRVMGNAAMRDQKVANALRTIDTWYAEFDLWGHPIAVEPNGANLEAQRFFRQGKASAFKLLRKLNKLNPNDADGQFTIACLIRGGVYWG